jgi:hypothetical protein
MGRLVSLLGDVFWSALMVLGLIIVAFFVLRMVAKVPALSGVTSKISDLATPPGN